MLVFMSASMPNTQWLTIMKSIPRFWISCGPGQTQVVLLGNLNHINRTVLKSGLAVHSWAFYLLQIINKKRNVSPIIALHTFFFELSSFLLMCLYLHVLRPREHKYARRLDRSFLFTNQWGRGPHYIQNLNTTLLACLVIISGWDT